MPGRPGWTFASSALGLSGLQGDRAAGAAGKGEGPLQPEADTAPLILTAALDEAAQARLGALRRAHFPPAINHLAAHLTLFHALPGDELEAVLQRLRAVTAVTEPLPLTVTGPRSLGRGVALTVTGEGLIALRGQLARAFAPWLGAQDRQGFRPHVTVQNKVTPEAAQALLAWLQASWQPLPAIAEGLALWRYRGGPWEAVATLSFTSPSLPERPG